MPNGNIYRCNFKSYYKHSLKTQLFKREHIYYNTSLPRRYTYNRTGFHNSVNSMQTAFHVKHFKLLLIALSLYTLHHSSPTATYHRPQHSQTLSYSLYSNIQQFSFKFQHSHRLLAFRFVQRIYCGLIYSIVIFGHAVRI